MEPAERARGLFLEGWSCAESVLMSVLEHLGVEADCSPRIATGFAAGVGGTGMVCGAISGAIIVAGWRHGRNELTDDRDKVMGICRTLIDDFQKEFGSASCRMLTGLDLTEAAERRRAREEGIFEKTCVPLVEFCAGRMAESLKEK